MKFIVLRKHSTAFLVTVSSFLNIFRNCANKIVLCFLFSFSFSNSNNTQLRCLDPIHESELDRDPQRAQLWKNVKKLRAKL